jgi:hypothetical protein
LSLSPFISLLILLAFPNAVQAEPGRPARRSEVPAVVEAELATREALCGLDGRGSMLLPQGAIVRSELNEDGRDDYILALCRLGCAGNATTFMRACDQSLIFLSSDSGYQPVRMPGELLDIRRISGKPIRLLSSAVSDNKACPVEDGVCNLLYEIRNGELVQSGIE